MNVTLRPGNAADAQRCGEICYNAFKAIAEQHNFPPDFPSPEIAIGLLFCWCLEHGLRVVQPMTLMSIGLYNEPAGGFLPSILY